MPQVTPLGYPHAGAGTVEILLKKTDGADFAVVFSPDPNNILLRESKQAMQFYYYPKNPRLAKYPDGKFKFSMQVFKSEGDAATVIGAEGLEEEAGAYTTFSSTIDVPEDLLKKAIDKLKDKLHTEFNNNRASKLFGLFSYLKGVDHDFDETNVRPIQLVQNSISMHVVGEKSPQNPFGGGNPWTFNIQGEGAGTTFGLGENALSIMMGRNSASLVKSALENGTNNLVVENSIKYKAFLPTTEIKVTVDAKKTHSYFSSKLGISAGFVDISWEHEYEKIITSGGITTEILTDEQFSTDERKKLEESLLTKARDFAFELLKRAILDPQDKAFSPAKDPNPKPGGIKIFGITIGGVSLGFSLKTATQIRELAFTDSIKFSAIEVCDSKISGSLDPLTSLSGDPAKEELKKYITDVRLDEDFSKIHVIASLNGGLIKLDKDGEIVNDSPVSQVSIEVGYPNSKGNLVLKSEARVIAPTGTPYVKTLNRAGKEIDGIYPTTWSDKSTEKNAFVFDFVKNNNPSPIHVRQIVMYEKDKRIKLKDVETTFQFNGTKIFIPLPVQNMLNYTLSTEQLYECDRLEVTFKADKMTTKKFIFTANNFEDMIPYRAWYELNYEIKPTQYKVKYTCTGKIGTKNKKITITKTTWEKLEYLEGDVLFEIPLGTEVQNKDIEKIRTALMG